MALTKSTFIKEYKKRMAETYGRSVEESDISEKYMVLGNLIRDYASINWMNTKKETSIKESKQMYYFSMEFLLGRLMTNNLMNLGIYNVVRDGLKDLGLDLNELENIESDAGLGNGGLGRLASCFLDSLASNSYLGNGNCIRYQYGFFKQVIDDNGNQVEVPDQWLRIGNVWEVRKPKRAVDVKFYGYVTSYYDNQGKMHFDTHDAEIVTAVPYDIPIIGANTKVVNTLRLWSCESSEKLPYNIEFDKYLADVSAINAHLYPNDSSISGKMLRLKQQYFFVCAGISSIVSAHYERYNTLDNLSEKVSIQLNDTHPVLAICELMRVLMDDYGYEWNDAYNITYNTFSYTNHTMLSEALEKWPTSYIRELLPRIYMIVEEINRRFINDVKHIFNNDYDILNSIAIISYDMVNMANLAIIMCHSVNGVSRIHSELIKRDLFYYFNLIYKDKFNNKTNGVTHRRWLLYSNPELSSLIDSLIGKSYHKDFNEIKKLEKFVDDKKVLDEFISVKKIRKEILKEYVYNNFNIKIDSNSIYDIQAKRLHGYKRQLLNCLKIITLYQRILKDPSYCIHPITFFFGAKAAPNYVFAKKVIQLINRLQYIINDDPNVRNMIKVVFIPNYSVSSAELLISASDVSEQISVAGKEASGTSNMKFMMNGAITLGTLDGANIEIDELVGRDNDIIFGLSEEEVNNYRNYYNVWDYYNNDYELRCAIDALVDGTLSDDYNEFKLIYDELLTKNDEYFVCADYGSYMSAYDRMNYKYSDKYGWAKSCLINISRSSYFSSDRTIKEYVDEIWHLDKVSVE